MGTRLAAVVWSLFLAGIGLQSGCGGASDPVSAGGAGGGAGAPATGGDGTATGGGTAIGGAGGGGGAATGGGGAATGGGGVATGGGGVATGGGGAAAGGGGVATGGGGAATGGAAGSAGSIAGPDAGNPAGRCAVPAEAQPEDVSTPKTVVGSGTPTSCTADAFVKAVANGGVITFNCGPDPVTITLTATAKVFNDKGPKIVIDGGNKVTLSGGGKVRILYQNTCDQAQVWTTARCDNQDSPQLTVQNLTFVDGNAKGTGNGGGAIFAQGGRLKVVNSRFFRNVCDSTGPDIGGGAIRALQQYSGLPLYVVGSTFGGSADLANVGSNGGALSSIGVSWTVINSQLSYNKAIGNGGNPATTGTTGGGSGGAIYNDGNKMTLTICGSQIDHNQVNAFGSAIFFVSNDHTGDICIDNSVITNNIGGSWYPAYPQISMHDDTKIVVTNSTIQ